MKLFNSDGQGLQRVTETYSGIVRTGLGLTAWTLAALVTLATALLAGKLLWSLFMLGLRWIEKI